MSGYLTQAEIAVMGDEWRAWNEVYRSNDQSGVRMPSTPELEDEQDTAVTPVVGYEHCHHCQKVYKSEDMSYVCTECAHSGCGNCVGSSNTASLNQVFSVVILHNPRNPESENRVIKLFHDNGDDETMCSECWRKEIAEMLM